MDALVFTANPNVATVSFTFMPQTKFTFKDSPEAMVRKRSLVFDAPKSKFADSSLGPYLGRAGNPQLFSNLLQDH
jgi:hypothetical protein